MNIIQCRGAKGKFSEKGMAIIFIFCISIAASLTDLHFESNHNIIS